MKFDCRDLALTAVFAALYAIINIVQTMTSGPITYGPVQLRLADCLIALSALFGWPLAIGVGIGCFSNVYYMLDPVDIIIGPIVNFAAASIVFALRRRKLLACTSGALVVGVPIGLYLYYLYVQGNPIIQQQTPNFGVPLPLWSAFVLSLVVSSLVAVSVIGSALLKALSRQGVIDSLRARGLKVIEEK
ncbi:QueT transporter family protein [Candidatus Bathyarchaeota archaeon]|nr:QueT transporter family protein [Candidatus Bathyarchaeota archaeon]